MKLIIYIFCHIIIITGCIGAHSKGEGKGTTFYLELPLFPKLSSIMNVEDVPRSKPSFYSSGIRRDYRSQCKIGMHPLGSGGDSNISLADLISLDRKLRSRAGSSEFIYNSENTVSRNMSCRSSSNRSERSLVQYSREDIIKAFDCSEGGTRSSASSFSNGIPGKVNFSTFFSRGDSLSTACVKTTPVSQKDDDRDEVKNGDINTVDLEAGLMKVINGPHLKSRVVDTVDVETGLMKMTNGPHLKTREVDPVDAEAGLMRVINGPHLKPREVDPVDVEAELMRVINGPYLKTRAGDPVDVEAGLMKVINGPHLKSDEEDRETCQLPRPIRVLVVDDSMPTRKLMQRVLSKKGYDVQCAEDGSVCLDILSGPSSACSSSSLEELENATIGLFDVIIMDDNMPNMGGREASKILRERGFNGMICGVTGNTSYEDERLFLAHGADMVLFKPLDLDLFEKKLEDYMNLKVSSENGIIQKSGGG